MSVLLSFNFLVGCTILTGTGMVDTWSAVEDDGTWVEADIHELDPEVAALEETAVCLLIRFVDASHCWVANGKLVAPAVASVILSACLMDFGLMLV